MMAEKHRPAAAVKNGLSLSADPTDSWCHAKAKPKVDTIYRRILNRSEDKELRFELVTRKNARWKWLMEMRRQSQRWELPVYENPNLLKSDAR